MSFLGSRSFLPTSITPSHSLDGRGPTPDPVLRRLCLPYVLSKSKQKIVVVPVPFIHSTIKFQVLPVLRFEFRVPTSSTNILIDPVNYKFNFILSEDSVLGLDVSFRGNLYDA